MTPILKAELIRSIIWKIFFLVIFYQSSEISTRPQICFTHTDDGCTVLIKLCEWVLSCNMYSFGE